MIPLMRFLNLFLSTVSLAAATLSALAQIPNSDFENWSGACSLDGWAINSVCEANLVPITRTTTAHSGQAAVRGEVVSFFGQVVQPVLQAGEDANGFVISQNYSTLDGFYQFAPLSGDRMSVNVALYQGNIEGGTLIAQGAKILPAAATYSAFSVNLTTLTGGVADRAYIQFMIIGPVTGSDFHVGSVMYVDTLSFGNATTTAEPRLTITRNGSNVVVSWPAEVTGFTLQSTTTLTPANWQNVPGLTATDRSYSFTPTGPIYFRLFKP
jgi:hypothetical protein